MNNKGMWNSLLAFGLVFLVYFFSIGLFAVAGEFLK